MRTKYGIENIEVAKICLQCPYKKCIENHRGCEYFKKKFKELKKDEIQRFKSR